MSRDLTNPLSRAVAQARKLPAETGIVSRYRGAGEIIMADVSSSMADKAGDRRKIQILQEALDWLRPAASCRIIAFASTPRVIEPGQPLPAPYGGTALHLALRYAAQSRPQHTIVISDGMPDDERAALAAAAEITGWIDVIYCGPDDDDRAIDFMGRMARAGRGSSVTVDLRREAARLAPALRQLAAPGLGQAG
jgi:hypothetical protein